MMTFDYARGLDEVCRDLIGRRIAYHGKEGLLTKLWAFPSLPERAAKKNEAKNPAGHLWTNLRYGHFITNLNIGDGDDNGIVVLAALATAEGTGKTSKALGIADKTLAGMADEIGFAVLQKEFVGPVYLRNLQGGRREYYCMLK